MKKIINIFMLCLTLLLCGIFVGCSDNNNTAPATFNDSQGLEYYPLDDGSFAVSLGNALFLKNIVIPEKFNNKPVTTIIGDTYSRLGNFEKKVETVSLPNSITSIGISAFYEFKNLKEITIPDSVTTIGNVAFCYCISLQEVSIPDSVNSIGDCAFEFCSNLKSVHLSTNLESIGKYSFGYCTQLKNIQLPEKLKSIGEYSFCSCTNLTTITIPNNVTDIGRYAFTMNTNINIILPANDQANYHKESFFATYVNYDEYPTTEIGTVQSPYHSIFYLGNQEQWDKLVESCSLNYNEVYFYTDTYQEGNYWHYDTDNKSPIKWGPSA